MLWKKWCGAKQVHSLYKYVTDPRIPQEIIQFPPLKKNLKIIKYLQKKLVLFSALKRKVSPTSFWQHVQARLKIQGLSSSLRGKPHCRETQRAAWQMIHTRKRAGSTGASAFSTHTALAYSGEWQILYFHQSKEDLCKKAICSLHPETPRCFNP